MPRIPAWPLALATAACVGEVQELQVPTPTPTPGAGTTVVAVQMLEAPPLTTVIAYDCDDDTGFTVEYRHATSTAYVFLESGSRELKSEPVEAGARYSDGEVTLWSNNVKTLINEPGRTRKCRENRARSIRETAKLEGQDFWATGNEPPWKMMIGAGEVEFLLGYDAIRHVAPTPEPTSDPAARSTVYRTTTAAGLDMVVTLRGIPCVDSMSGETFETIVEVRLSGRPYRGCGLALH